MAQDGPFYKIRLLNGRVLGPLDLERVKLLIRKKHVVGEETARHYPEGEWMDINAIPEIASILLSQASGNVTKVVDPAAAAESGVGYEPLLGAHAQTVPLPGATQILPTHGSLNELPEMGSLSGTAAPGQAPEPSLPGGASVPIEGSQSVALDGAAPARPIATGPDAIDPDDEKTTVTQTHAASVEIDAAALRDAGMDVEEPTSHVEGIAFVENRLAQEKTVVFQRSSDSASLPGRRKRTRGELLKQGAVVAAVLFAAMELLSDDEPAPGRVIRQEAIRPKLPAYIQGKSDPGMSMKLYTEGMRFYVLDHVVGYRLASEKFRSAASYDVNNVKALAMLASAYLNLIDSSNKDENYFTVIYQLIDRSRAKDIELPETVISDVEFFIMGGKPEAAQNRIVDYTKSHANFGVEMFYYLSLAYFARGDYQSAVTYLNQFPDKQIYSPRIYWLKGQLAEKLGDIPVALNEYQRAVAFSKEHARSRLRIADLLGKQGKLREAAPHLEYLMTHTQLLPPKELALAYFLHAQLSELFQKWDLALGDVERAVKLDKDNHDYILEQYTLRAKVGDSLQSVQKQARMYFYLGEGEKLLRVGQYQEALTQFLQAAQSNDASPLPWVKTGDMFKYLHDYANARLNYQKASERAPNNIEVWSKYIDILIKSYEWEEAMKAMDKFRRLPVSQSAIDKAAADMYMKQGRFAEAQTYYKKAMSRESIDPDVYVAFAQSLSATGNCKEAPFFFALGLRLDPLNLDAILGTAKCVADTDSIDRAISLLQDELSKQKSQRAELLSAIAEFQIRKGAWEQAQQNIDQAREANAEYAYPWKLQAQIHLNREGLDKDAVDRALFAYKSYSERNPSDPSGYLERYKMFIKKAEFEKASEELSKIYAVYPKYPNLHYYKGAMYSVMGNHKAAAEEFESELKNNPGSIQALIALGKELMEQGNPTEALKLFNKAMQAAPGVAEAKHQAGWANCALKNYAAAIALMNGALGIDKGNALIYKHMALCYREAGDGGNAGMAARKYLEMEPDAPDKAEFEKLY